MHKGIWRVTALALAAAVTLIGLLTASHYKILLGDFRAFYCGGQALRHGLDPYAAASLISCERAHQPLGLYSTSDSLVIPAPLPIYALVLLAAFTVVPYPFAALIWLALNLVSLIVAVLILMRLSGRSFAALVLAFIGIFSALVLPLGQSTGVVLLSLVSAALAARVGKPVVAVAGLCCMSLAPHVALPAFVALFIAVRSARASVIVAVMALGVLNFLTGNLPSAISYLTIVLPAHAAAEVGSVFQYSLAWLALASGASPSAALTLGAASYIGAVICGVIVGIRLSRQFNDAAFTVLLPAAFAVIGGTFVHLQEIALALPAAILLHLRADKRARGAAAASIVLIAMPWLAVINQPWLVAMIAVATVFIGIDLLGLDVKLSLCVSLASVALCALIQLIAAHYGAVLTSKNGAHVTGALAQASWAQYVPNSVGATWIFAKAPTWAGLLLFVVASILTMSKQKASLSSDRASV